MRAAFLTSGLLALVVLLSASVTDAQWTADIAWNSCAGTSGPEGPAARNVDWGGPKTYKLYLSAKGLTVQSGYRVYSHQVDLRIGPNVPDAWRFDEQGCMPNNFSQISLNSLGTSSCPGLRSGSEVPVAGWFHDLATGEARFSAATAYPNGRIPNSGTNYLLWEISFAMSAAAGPGDPGPCGGADKAQAFEITQASVWAGPSSLSTFREDGNIQTTFVTFNDPQGKLSGPGGGTVEEGTWGRVKGMYR